MKTVIEINKVLNKIIWGTPTQILLLGVGILLMITSGFVVFRKAKYIWANTFGKIFERVKADEGYLTPFQAVSTALAATVGTGNIAGVALAISTGGPGALFWIWAAAIIGMSTKFAEVTLACATATYNSKGQRVGGPMYYIERGLGFKTLAKIFALFGGLACFGIGCMTQSNSIASTLKSTFNINKTYTGIVIVILLTFVLIGGVKRIGTVTEKIVPFMALFYIVGGLIVIIIERNALPNALVLIFKSAFTNRAALGGFAGASVGLAMRSGISRGIFTNEAGLGSAPIAHAASQIDHPVRQGMWAVFEVFMDTLVVCTITGLVVVISGMWTNGDVEGADMTIKAFETGFTGAKYIVTIGLTLFAFTTIIGWSYYGEKCNEYLFGREISLPFRIIYIIMAFVGSIGGLQAIWSITDTLNGMMAIPNLIGLVFLYKPFKKLVNDFFQNPDKEFKDRDYMEFFK
ncbi:MAG: sodium:alanine symporter family protein [Peptoniphilaceae bacterium]|nr:sodium:alanine symporter family protein [Peptoniphilaceae bacterium]MDY6018601.1 sodium:alanine symporter family protein [Anaerococcus sp.]